MARYAALPNVAPAQLDLDVYRGDSFSIFVKLSSQGATVHTDGFTFNADIRLGPESPVVQSFSIDANVAYGCIRLFLTSEATQVLPAAAIWDLQYRRPVGDDRVQTILRGNIFTFPDVTYVSESRGGRRARI